ncbi:YcjF family protein [Nisaea nitritireducens]|uniref:YcjF family protein n=1 Tax=Nisaea nitritireducens TaxID=568392 RepID=UPI0018672A3F|nr:DUF697 domain-containing protein [Nisaea nitritireducens]
MKKLPGLNRRAPNATAMPEAPSPNVEGDGLEDTSADPASPSRSKAKTRPRSHAGKSKSHSTQSRAQQKRSDTIHSVSAEHDGKPIETEIISRSSQAGMSINFDRAIAVVNRRVKWAAAGGVIPVPFVDIAAIAAVQLTMLREISKIYDVPFSANRGRAIISTLVGSVFPWAAGAGLAGLLVKATPVLGWGVGLATISVLAATSTRAMGLVFIQHFESGGNLFDFDPAAKQDYFYQEYEKAKPA